MTQIEDLLQSHRDAIADAFKKTPFLVFLCGPSLSRAEGCPAAALRKKIRDKLLEEGFLVVLGEDDGLDCDEIKALGLNAQDNELEFIRTSCNAVIVVAASVGSFCELGLFSWHFVHKKGLIKPNSRTDFTLLVEKKYESETSYLNAGPAKAVKHFGHLEYTDFDSYDVMPLLERLKEKRSVFAVDRRGRPRGTAK